MTGPRVPDGARAGVAAALHSPAGESCAETAELFDEYCADRRAREHAHLLRIDVEGRRLGKLVGAYELTMPDATVRLERMCDVLDVGCTAVPLRLVPLAIGRKVARDAFADGMELATVRRAS